MTDSAEQTRMILDGDFKNHPFRGNGAVKASAGSSAASSSSRRAKRAEKHGDAKAQAKAHKTAYYAHKAAASEATGITKAYHKKMAKFHGSRSGAKVLDSIAPVSAAVLDAVDGNDIEGVITKDGAVIGRVGISSGDGKAQVFAGAEGAEAVKSADGVAYRYTTSEQDLGEMVAALMATPLPGGAVEVAGAEPEPIRTLLTEEEQAALGERHDALDVRIDALGDEEVKALAKSLGVRAGSDAGLRDKIKQQHPDDIEAAIDKIAPAVGPDWYERRGELSPGMVFQTYDGIVRLVRRVDGDGTKWEVDDWFNGHWSAEESEIEPGDLQGDPLSDPPEQSAEARDPRDVATDPDGTLVVDPAEPLPAAENPSGTVITFVSTQSYQKRTIDLATAPIADVDDALGTGYGMGDMEMVNLIDRVRPEIRAYVAKKVADREAADKPFEFKPEMYGSNAPTAAERSRDSNDNDIVDLNAADRAYLESLVDGTGDILAADTFDRMEPMFTKYEGDAEMSALLERAATAYGDAAVAAAQGGTAKAA